MSVAVCVAKANEVQLFTADTFEAVLNNIASFSHSLDQGACVDLTNSASTAWNSVAAVTPDIFKTVFHQ